MDEKIKILDYLIQRLYGWGKVRLNKSLPADPLYDAAKYLTEYRDLLTNSSSNV